ncbi:glycoprotein-N-acetylgalactosamine 3-beta-galactosyltransferase 1-like [Musca vetustissima]|uniref:glycoprotein-N-acetylgalactosamine 3-beta-galactosyltransferase 1-like n=1 Tax=Musca vetustissima TaxID=27455 RepID=UPI002AB6060F|nr:glycoprotein-N-acetylgalactosamine 3-beta-galactosyltransferase 1-like [Musca vetustissima]
MVEYLFNTTRVLCWIVTNPANHLTKAIHIRHTWGRRCNKLLFISSEADDILQTIQLPVAEGRDYLWFKTKMGLKYIYDNHIDDADWFLKADDDTYVIMENLRYFLHQYSSDIPIYFGCKFDRYIKQGYMSGGAGYVMSKKALIKFATEAYDNNRLCKYKTIAEDQQLGICMENIGVIAGDSRDANGMERFIPLPPVDVQPESHVEWYIKWVYHEPEKNVSCCSPHAISFHYITPDEFYVLEYLIYTLRPFGAPVYESLPTKINVSEIYAAGMPDAEPLMVPQTVDSNG